MISFWQGFAVVIVFIIVYFMATKKSKENGKPIKEEVEDLMQSGGRGVGKFIDGVKNPFKEIEDKVETKQVTNK